MLSYRHGFHAGNHADILKHFCLFALIARLQQKSKPFTYMDSHSGAGLYDIDSPESLKTNEYETGAALLSSDSVGEPCLQRYVSLINECGEPNQYPGSCYIAAKLLRADDRAHLMELHPSEITQLRKKLGNAANVHIHHRDGFEGMLALSPPQPRRGLVLIDPPYEQTQEYRQVGDCVEALFSKWPQAIVAIWYPLLTERAGDKQGRSEAMLERLVGRVNSSVLDIRMSIDASSAPLGMFGSGMVIINAPWQFDADVGSGLKEMHAVLDQSGVGELSIEWRKEAA